MFYWLQIMQKILEPFWLHNCFLHIVYKSVLRYRRYEFGGKTVGVE